MMFKERLGLRPHTVPKQLARRKDARRPRASIGHVGSLSRRQPERSHQLLRHPAGAGDAALAPRRHNRGTHGQLPARATLAVCDTCTQRASPALDRKQSTASSPRWPPAGRQGSSYLAPAASKGAGLPPTETRGEPGKSGGCRQPARHLQRMLRRPLSCVQGASGRTHLCAPNADCSLHTARGDTGSVPPCPGAPRSPRPGGSTPGGAEARGSPEPRPTRSTGAPGTGQGSRPPAPRPSSSAPAGGAAARHRQGPTGAGDTGGDRDAAHVLPRRRPAPHRETLSPGQAPGAAQLSPPPRRRPGHPAPSAGSSRYRNRRLSASQAPPPRPQVAEDGAGGTRQAPP